jgi:four helix bundle protein
MGVCRFEDLRVWQAAKDQCDRFGMLRKRPEFAKDPELSDQMNRASISVMFNISEGFLRRRDGETAQFLRYAFASNGELKCGYYAAQGRKYLSADEAADLIALNDSIARMLRRWQATLDVDETNAGRRKRTVGGRTRHRGLRTDPGPSTDPGPGTDQGPSTDQEPRPKA